MKLKLMPMASTVLFVKHEDGSAKQHYVVGVKSFDETDGLMFVRLYGNLYSYAKTCGVKKGDIIYLEDWVVDGGEKQDKFYTFVNKCKIFKGSIGS